MPIMLLIHSHTRHFCWSRVLRFSGVNLFAVDLEHVPGGEVSIPRQLGLFAFFSWLLSSSQLTPTDAQVDFWLGPVFVDLQAPIESHLHFRYKFFVKYPRTA